MALVQFRVVQVAASLEAVGLGLPAEHPVLEMALGVVGLVRVAVADLH